MAQVTIVKDERNQKPVRVVLSIGKRFEVEANSEQGETLASVLQAAARMAPGGESLVVAEKEGARLKVDGEYYVTVRDANGNSTGQHTSDPNYPVPAGATVTRSNRVSNG